MHASFTPCSKEDFASSDMRQSILPPESVLCPRHGSDLSQGYHYLKQEKPMTIRGEFQSLRGMLQEDSFRASKTCRILGRFPPYCSHARPIMTTWKYSSIDSHGWISGHAGQFLAVKAGSPSSACLENDGTKVFAFGKTDRQH